MNSDEQIKTIVGWMTVAAAILSPVLLLLVIFKLIRDYLNGAPVDLLNGDFLFIAGFCVFGFLFAVAYGKFQLGWFQKNEND